MITTIRDEARDLTAHLCEGRVAIEEIAETIRKFYSGVPTRHVLWDLTEADVSDIHSSQIESLADLVKSIAHSRSGGKTALVAASDLSFGLSRVYQALAEITDQASELQVFRSVEEARAWIAG